MHQRYVHLYSYLSNVNKTVRKLHKIQHLFLTIAVPIKCMIKCNVENEKNCLCAWKVKQRKLNEMKTWICRQGIILFVPMHPLCQCFPVIFSNHLASILQTYPLLYSKPWQKSKMESFSRKVMGKNSIPVENLQFFDNFRGRGSAEVN